MPPFIMHTKLCVGTAAIHAGHLGADCSAYLLIADEMLYCGIRRDGPIAAADS